MGEVTKIQWAHHTFNPWIGCAKVSQACANCYAEVNRFVTIQRGKGRELWGPKADRHVTSPSNWRQPLAWDRAAAAAGERHRVFCASLSDVFEDRPDRPDLREPRARLWYLILHTPHLDWLLLTKRPENANRLWAQAQDDAFNGYDSAGATWGDNVWLGASYDDKGAARADALREVPAKVRFLSVEPLVADPGVLDLRGIHWVIGGGESGPGARPCATEWLERVLEQCRAAGVPFFCKQLGSVVVSEERTMPLDLMCETWGRKPSEYAGHIAPNGEVWAWTAGLRDRKGGDPSEWPDSLRVREFPRVTA